MAVSTLQALEVLNASPNGAFAGEELSFELSQRYTPG